MQIGGHARPGTSRRPTASAARPRSSGRRCAAIAADERRPARAGDAPRSSRRRRHRTTPARGRGGRRSRRRSGDAETTTSSTEANRVRSARPSPGATVDDVSAGVRSVGLGHDRQDPRRRRGRAIGAGSPPSDARSIRVSARSASSREMARWAVRADHVEIGLRLRAGEPGRAARRAERSRPPGRPASNRPRPRRRRSVDFDPSARGGVGGRQQQVVAGTDRGDDLDRLGGALRERAHVERVADR